ncbi:MAG: GTP 3',8-cyclase MoaA [Bryobacteraceae bacterium]
MPLIDSFGRLHNNLRISVTDRCNIRCYYCMPESVKFGSRSEILSYEELERVARIAADLGFHKIRITGGEPLVRQNLAGFIDRLRQIDSVRDIALTTNGVLLADQAQALFDAGLKRINIHLDTLDRVLFEKITRRDELPRVLAGINVCLKLGYRIKINAVALKGVNEPDIVELARFGRETGIEIRYIEFMPLDSQGIWDLSRVMLESDMRQLLSDAIGPLEPASDNDPSAPATDYVFHDGKGRVGFIASVSKPFCGNCNRLRLTADGKLRYCLFAIAETDVKDLLRNGGSDRSIAEAIASTVASKWAGHEINQSTFVAPPRPMYAIGG